MIPKSSSKERKKILPIPPRKFPEFKPREEMIPWSTAPTKSLKQGGEKVPQFGSSGKEKGGTPRPPWSRIPSKKGSLKPK
jgi:hypothetical protein